MCIGCESKQICCKFLFLHSRPLQTMANNLRVSITARKCMCASGNALSWLIKQLEIWSQCRIWNYSYRSSVRPVVSVPSCTSRRRRRRPLSGRPSHRRPPLCPSVQSYPVVVFCAYVRSIARAVVVVRPMSVRPRRAPTYYSHE